jgi:predicted permease
MQFVRFGNRLRLREEARDMWGFLELERLWADLRQATRRVTHQPGPALVVVLTLALGIAATTAMFSLVDALFFRPAPLREASRLVWIAGLKGRSAGLRNVSYPDYVAYRDRATRLSGVAASGGTAVALGGRSPQRVLGGLVSGNYFDVIGLRAQIGRTFTTAEDAESGAHPVVVLGDATWRKHFAADPQVVGTTVAINGQPFAIVGVAPPGFTGVAFANDPEALWMPMAMQPLVMPRSPDLLRDASQSWLLVVGRLRDRVTKEEADAEIGVIARQVNTPGTPDDEVRSARILPLHGGLTPWEQESLAPMFAMISIVPGLVLLVACANVANVLMAHHLSRRREFAMRRALGASRGRLIRQLLAESTILALLAAFVGYALSFVLSATVVHFGEVPGDVLALMVPDVRAFLAATVIAMAAVFVYAFAPAVTATRLDVLPILKDEGLTATAARAPARLRRLSIVAQMALSLVLLIGAGLFVQSLWRAMQVAPGFDPHGLAVVSFDLDLLDYPPDRRTAFVSQFSERAAALPAVSSIATADVLPFGGTMYSATIVAADGQSFPRATRVSVSTDYFKTLELPIVRGRAFTQSEVASNAPVAIVDETVARRLWPAGDPIGQRVQEADVREGSREIVGVVADTKFLFPTESPGGAFYLPQRDANPQFVVRTTGTPAAALTELSAVARSLDPNLPISQQQTMDERIRRMVTLRRASVALLGVLAALTLALASVGIFGVAANNVSTRTREIGIRVALGARRSQVLRIIVREQLSLTLIGLAVGTGLGVVGSTLLASFLFGVTPTDSLTFGGASAILGLVSLAASYLPARRAARLDPLVALRRE